MGFSFESAIQLQRQIALIQTITPDAGILQISQAVRDISDTFNLDIVETAAGLLALPYGALAFEVRRPRLEPYDVRLLELQLGRVLNGYDALFR